MCSTTGDAGSVRLYVGISGGEASSELSVDAPPPPPPHHTRYTAHTVTTSDFLGKPDVITSVNTLPGRSRETSFMIST